MNLCRESNLLLKELRELSREYDFAMSRAQAHRQRATEGDLLEALLYQGALQRMEEIEARTLVIDSRLTFIHKQTLEQNGRTNARK